LAGQAGRAQPEELEAVLVHPVAGPTGDLANHHPQPCVIDLARAAAARAHDVMVVGTLADDVCVFAGRKVEALHGPELFEDLEGPEDRGASDTEASLLSVREEVACGEVSFAPANQGGQSPARTREAVAGPIQGCNDGCRVHARSIAQLRLCLNRAGGYGFAGFAPA
jgi:hypothetical protein